MSSMEILSNPDALLRFQSTPKFDLKPVLFPSVPDEAPSTPNDTPRKGLGPLRPPGTPNLSTYHPISMGPEMLLRMSHEYRKNRLKTSSDCSMDSPASERSRHDTESSSPNIAMTKSLEDLRRSSDESRNRLYSSTPDSLGSSSEKLSQLAINPISNPIQEQAAPSTPPMRESIGSEESTKSKFTFTFSALSQALISESQRGDDMNTNSKSSLSFGEGRSKGFVFPDVPQLGSVSSPPSLGDVGHYAQFSTLFFTHTKENTNL